MDLDEIHHYAYIHGLAARSGAAAHAVYDVALGRVEGFALEQGLPVTLFAVGEDLGRPESAAALRRLSDAGHPVENHSLSHRYDLTRLDPAAMAAEVVGGARAIEAATGRAPAGFRAPGYTISDALFDVLEEAGVRFDSSVFPCPAYWAAKAVAMGVIRARGRRSRSILGGPGVLAAPSRPYRPGRPYTRRARRGGPTRALVELPIQVTPLVRLPVIGTSLALAGPAGARLLARGCASAPLVNLELHGIDFLGAEDGLEPLVGHQPELRIPLAQRLEALAAFVEALRADGRAFVRLDEAAERYSAAGL